MELTDTMMSEDSYSFYVEKKVLNHPELSGWLKERRLWPGAVRNDIELFFQACRDLAVPLWSQTKEELAADAAKEVDEAAEWLLGKMEEAGRKADDEGDYAYWMASRVVVGEGRVRRLTRRLEIESAARAAQAAEYARLSGAPVAEPSAPDVSGQPDAPEVKDGIEKLANAARQSPDRAYVLAQRALAAEEEVERLATQLKDEIKTRHEQGMEYARLLAMSADD